jgi:AraC family transcriptional regulator of adaptative response / DNA-3-methyladenine glycosylase II
VASVYRQLSYLRPLAADALLEFLEGRAIPGVESVADGSYARSVRTSDGRPALVSLRFESDAGSVSLTVDGLGEPERVDELEGGARRLLDLDADVAAIDRDLAHDPALGELVRRTPGLRVPGGFDGFELVVRAIVGQQVSVPGARTTLGRIVRELGTPLERSQGAVTHLFPEPERLADAPERAFGMPRMRAAAIRRVAELVASGELELTGGGEGSRILPVLTGIPGVGPWTAAYVAMRALRDRDAFPRGDLGVLRAGRALGLGDDARAIERRAESWRPWRAYAVVRLWQSSSGA